MSLGCSACLGEGRVQRDCWFSASDYDCPGCASRWECDGTKPCPECNGSGQITLDLAEARRYLRGAA
jgi:DnaJ-class molecular chaperone